MRILMVDDRIDDGDRVIRVLRTKWNHLEVTRVGDPTRYERALDTGSFDLVLTENTLAWTGALAVLRDVRDRRPAIPVILLTGPGCERLAIEGFRAGLSDYVCKDQMEEELLPAILRVTGRRHLGADVAPKDEELAYLQAELRRERDLLQTIYDHAPVMVTIYDPLTRRTQLGKHVERLTGWTETDVAETPILELCYPDADYRAEVIAYRDSLTPGYRDMEMMSKRGEVIEASWANIGLPDGRRMGIGLDITQRKQAERELQRSVAEFTALYHQMTEGLVLFDPQGNLLDMNPAALAIHGFEAGDDIHDIRRHLNTLDDTFQLFDLETDRVLATDEWPIGRVLRGETFSSFEVRVRRTSTERTWIGSYGGTPVYGPDGELLLAIVTLRDVTAQREAERVLSESEARTRTILESIADGFLALDREWTCTYVNENAARIIGMKREDLVGGNIWNLFPEARNRKFFNEYHRAVEIGTPTHFEEFYPAPLNLWLEFHCFPSSDGLSVYFRDITQRREADVALRQHAAELEAVNDANRLLLREVNHRVKNNLTAILGLIYAEQRRLGAEACQTTTHTRCEAALEDLSERVRSLSIAHSLLSASGWRPLRADQLVEAVVEATVPAATDAAALVLDVTGDPLCVSPEQAHCLALVIGELTTNTVKYGVGADRLHISVEIGVENGEASMIYRNSGPGYPETVLNGEGHSVGLGLVKTLVTHSLRGSWSLRNDGGPVTEIHFPLSHDANLRSRPSPSTSATNNKSR
jgi:PAS domain S-box-containing protein